MKFYIVIKTPGGNVWFWDGHTKNWGPDRLAENYVDMKIAKEAFKKMKKSEGEAIAIRAQILEFDINAPLNELKYDRNTHIEG